MDKVQKYNSFNDIYSADQEIGGLFLPSPFDPVWIQLNPVHIFTAKFF
jgi:hypothetical protein